MGYPGLPRDTVAFLRDLRDHNSRDWFEAHRADFHLIVRTQADLPAPDWLFSPKAPDHLSAITRAHLPLLDWLVA